MKTLYWECKMGASGTMLMASLYELLPAPEQFCFLEQMNHLIPGITISAQKKSACGITGTHMELVHQKGSESHSRRRHNTLADLASIVSHFPLPATVLENANAVCQRIWTVKSDHAAFSVESPSDGSDVFGTILDVTGTCLAIHLLNPEHIVVSPIHLGNGQVRTSYGMVPVPMPATVKLLEGIPCYCGDIQGELCTPTGAALLARFGKEFCAMPPMTLLSTGCGMGTRKYPAANCVRAFWGERNDQGRPAIVELCCHIDDMTAEALAYAGERLLALGALDVTSAPLVMKKGRAGILFTVLCKPADEERIAHAVLRETSTSGIRVRHCSKYILTPSIRTIETNYGSIRIKCADGAGIHREKPEYEDVANAARQTSVPFQQVWEDALFAAQTRQQDVSPMELSR